MPIDYTTVLGVDKKHLEQLALVWPTWLFHKPSLLDHPLVVFYDRFSVNSDQIASVIGDHPNHAFYSWPHNEVYYSGTPGDKWNSPQRYKMLAGFVYVPAVCVQTPYWLKLDVDSVATGMDDWIDPDWFVDEPAIVAQPWGFTKPPEQMQHLDDWADRMALLLAEFDAPGTPGPLGLKPNEGSSRLNHKRIISWCGFFRTDVTIGAAAAAERTCGKFKLPVPSQDGYIWYYTKRCGLEVRRENMKQRGWAHWTTMHNIRTHVAEAMQ